MITNFINYMRVYFNNSGYHRLPLANNNFYSFIKQAQNHIYIINLFDMNFKPINQWCNTTKQIETELYSYFDRLPVHRKIVLNIFVGDNNISELYSELNKVPMDFDSEIMSINWFVDVMEKKLLIADHIPNKILGIEKEIYNYLNPNQESHIKTFKLEKITSKSTITYTFIGVNIILWIIFKSFFEESFILKYFGLNSIAIFKRYELWRLFTSMFTHLTISHLAYNMLSLYIFGSRLEKYFGPIQFTVVYILSGLIAGFTSALVTYLSYSSIISSQIYAIGASGAIFGIIGAALSVTHASHQEIEELNSFTIFIIAIVGIVMGFAYKNVDNIAHIVGMVSGFILTNFIIIPNRQ